MNSKLQVGINSYVTLEEADVYVSTYYMTTSPEYQAWNSEDITSSDKETALIASAQALNGLRYTGRKKIYGQRLAFPRVNTLVPGVYYTPFVIQDGDASLMSCGFGLDDGLEAAKAAQIENTISHLLYGCTYTTTKRRALSGLTSKRADDISESYSINRAVLDEAETGLYAAVKVKTLLKSWLDSSVYTF